MKMNSEDREIKKERVKLSKIFNLQKAPSALLSASVMTPKVKALLIEHEKRTGALCGLSDSQISQVKELMKTTPLDFWAAYHEVMK